MESKQEEKKEFYKHFYHRGSAKVGILVLPGFQSELNEAGLLLKYLVEKNYTILAPTFRGYNKDNHIEEVNSSDPQNWLKEAKERLDELSAQVENVFVVGLSFGGNLAVALTHNNGDKVRGVITLEMPVFFRTKLAFAVNFIRPIFIFFGVDYAKKRKLWWRNGYKRSNDQKRPLPLVVIGKINRFIKKNTRKQLKNIKKPFLIIQAEKSDLIKTKSAKYVMKKIKSSNKKIFNLRVDNHDFNLLDEEGKYLMLDMMHSFIKNN